MKVLTAAVAVEKTAFHFDRLFSYRVPEELAGSVSRGVRVLIPFGRGNRLSQGLVFSVCEEEPKPGLKEIIVALDPEPILDEEGFRIVEYMADSTFCSRYDAVRCLVPAGLSVEAKTTYSFQKGFEKEMLPNLPKEEQLLIRLMLSVDSQRELNLLFAGSGAAVRRKTAESLVKKGILKEEQTLARKVGDKTTRMVRLCEGVDAEAPGCTPKQKEVLRILEAVGAAAEREVAYHAGVTDAVVKALVKKGLCEYFEQIVYRTPKMPEGRVEPDELTLSAKQQEVYEGLRSLYDKDEAAAALLFGVTGSGKTQVFIRLIQNCLADGRQAILMVPEIALTPQMLRKFRGYFGEDVAVLHSSLSLGERLDEYRRIKAGEARIIIGTRSSVFAPCSRLGLIIMDEEGEHSYKSDTTPRYHARDIAKLRCVHHRALLLLASATPSVESYYAAKTGRYHLFTMTERYGKAALPSVEMIDMMVEERNGNYSPLSDTLAESLLQTYERGEQSIVLLNRRGYATFSLCTDCGEAVKCPNCSVSLTYHKANGYLMCHYCGFTRRPQEPCSACGSKHLRLMGTGTQKVEDLIAKQIPSAKILRMDTDTTYSRYAYEEKFSRFEAGEYDIMIGTQMVAKGLNFPGVTLVGVLGADQYLYSGDFRCGEKTFSLITQVVGRSGRYEKPGLACIQTVSPDHPVIRYAAAQDYEGFYSEEIQIRRAALQPPFCDLLVAGFSGTDEQKVAECAEKFHAILRKKLLAAEAIPAVLLSVSQAAVYRVGGKFRRRIVVKCKNNRRFRDLLRQAVAEADSEKLFRGVSVYLDMNGEIG